MSPKNFIDLNVAHANKIELVDLFKANSSKYSAIELGNAELSKKLKY